MHKLGFGCVRLTYNLTVAKAVTNLETAYEEGITHFDVARLYGFGAAENILGKFAKNKRDKITITSKFGISPGNPVMKNLYVQNVARRLFHIAKRLPLKKSTDVAAKKVMSPQKFSVAEAQSSLETSLRELNTDYIDYYLLHEPVIGDLYNDELTNFLELQKKKGTIREYGIGSFTDTIVDDISRFPQSYSILQTDVSFPNSFPFSDHPAIKNKTFFFFSPFKYYTEVKQILLQDSALSASIKQKLNFGTKTNLLDLFLLHHLYNVSSSSTTLFTSSNNKNIKATIDRWNYLQTIAIPDNAMSEIANTLHECIKSKQQR